MPYYRMVQRLQLRTGAPEDVVVNNWTIRTTDPLDEDGADDAFAALQSFWTADNGVADSDLARLLLPESVQQNGHQVKFYELETAPPHLPLFTYTWNLPEDTDGSTGMPHEVAICLSLKGNAVAGTFTGPGPHLPARHLNRVYLGPLRTTVVTTESDQPRVGSTLRGYILTALDRMCDLLIASSTPGLRLGIWSPTRDDGDLAQSAWVDNAFDTQRRRGIASSARTTIALPSA